MENVIDLSYIIPPVDKALIKEELKKADFLKKTNSAGREIYVTNAHRTPASPDSHLLTPVYSFLSQQLYTSIV